tara:strand:- start:2771 stop:3826 length:1056 start_codon:yes stop_codon:yes gene_type:complete
MAVATKTEYWNSRMNGTDPSALTGTFNDTWSGSGGSASGGNWVITNGTWTITPTTNAYTLVACLEYTTAPDNGEVLMRLDNGTHKVEVQSTGTNTSLSLVGTSTVTISDLDLALDEEKPVALFLRLTLASDGSAKLYTHEIINDDDANAVFSTVTGSSGSGKTVRWGNTTGSVKWASVYYSKFGAFSPEELLISDFAQDTLARMGIGIVDQIKNSPRPYLKTQVDDSSIVYGYDISSQMINRIGSPSIHVLVEQVDSPQFESLGGAKITQQYDVKVFISVKGTNYENAYRKSLNIMGEVFDELYVNTGVEGTTDSIIGFTADLDPKMDNDEVVCVHVLTLTYMRRIDMRHR